MQGSKKLVLILVLFISTRAYSQEEGILSKPGKTIKYALVAYFSGGIDYYLPIKGDPDYLQPKVSKWCPVSTIRLMWHPNHLIRVGIETGHMRFLSYSFKDSIGNNGRVLVNAKPLLVEWSMAITKRLNLFAGSGVYFMTTKLDYAGQTSSNKLSVGWMAAASYIHPLSQNFGIGTELKWLDAAESTDGSLALQLQLVWKFLKW